ncbi:ferric reductase-like transmembrane domain-containing protein [Microcoleus sp. POL10_C6]|uniref:ferric reductase-like transmembrane domain-containing protein n=1 Tax=unclassified Microcoleus TaxID=2642155 RepID=UPI002FD0F490
MQLSTMDLDTFSQASILGFAALAGYILTLLPTNLRIVFPLTKKTGFPQWLLKYRRFIGLISFFLAVAHGFIFFKQRNFDIFDIKTYFVYFQGVATFIIFTLLAITSNDWSVKRLKKNWKKLQSLTYLAMFLVTWHIWDKMAGHWTYLTPVGIAAITATIVLFLGRVLIERQSKQQKHQPTEGKVTVLTRVWDSISQR